MWDERRLSIKLLMTRKNEGILLVVVTRFNRVYNYTRTVFFIMALLNY